MISRALLKNLNNRVYRGFQGTHFKLLKKIVEPQFNPYQKYKFNQLYSEYSGFQVLSKIAVYSSLFSLGQYKKIHVFLFIELRAFFKFNFFEYIENVRTSIQNVFNF